MSDSLQFSRQEETMTELEREREARAAQERAVQVAELERANAELRLKQRSDARKTEVENARSALAELERRNAEEEAADKLTAPAPVPHAAPPHAQPIAATAAERPKPPIVK